ncbi:MAG: 1-phosphofructokinase family hexose kinase [Solobacterium sp.]|nr:1-phosphofructokinase family hexose kinase [Solobacterium sp.]
MIVTCTLNPSLDCYMEFNDEIKEGRVNRSVLEYYEAGGKGINVSVVLNNLGVPTKAYGFLGGFVKDFYLSLLSKYERIEPNFTYIEGNTRINLKLIHEDTDTDLNACGPYITDEAMENLRAKVSRLDEGDYFALCGNTQPNLNESVKEMVQELQDAKVKVILATNYDLLITLLDKKPFLVKITDDELHKYYDDLEDAKDYGRIAKELREKGAENVLVVYDNEKTVLSCEMGEFTCKFAHDDVVNSVGVGDSLVAGFLMNYIRSRDVVDSFRFGSACGSATAYSKTLATREKVDTYYQEVEVRKLND